MNVMFGNPAKSATAIGLVDVIWPLLEPWIYCVRLEVEYLANPHRIE
jgi:hypothetical protein